MDSYHRSFDLPVVRRCGRSTPTARGSPRARSSRRSSARRSPARRCGSARSTRGATSPSSRTPPPASSPRRTAEDAVGRTIQLGTDHDVSVGELVELVGEVLGRELSVETDPRRVRPEASEVERLISGPFLAEELLGWRAEVPLSEGLAQTIAWIERNAERYRASDYVI